MIFKDQLNREIILYEYPRRVISLVPSITELLFDLKLNEEVIGITKFCVHPQQWFKTKTRIGGTKNIDVNLIASLNPQLIIANKEENVKEQVDELAANFPVYVSDVFDLPSALQMIYNIGTLTNKEHEAETIIQKIKTGFENLACKQSDESLGIRICYLIWKDLYMTIGGDTFINDMIERCGMINIFKDCQRYPEISINQLHALNCQLILLSSEPYPFKQKHITELQALLPSVKIILADGEMFSWYGSRLQLAAEYFKKIITDNFS